MAIRIRVPEGIQEGFKVGGWLFAVGFGWHTLQCDQRWYGVRVGMLYLAYRTRGDATGATYDDGGMWWPWHWRRTGSGRYL